MFFGKLKRGREEKKRKIVIWVLENSGMESYKNKELQRERDVCQPVFSGASTQATTHTEKEEIEKL